MESKRKNTSSLIYDNESIQSRIDNILMDYMSDNITDIDDISDAKFNAAEEKLYNSGNQNDIEEFEQLHTKLNNIYSNDNEKQKKDHKKMRYQTPPKRIPDTIDASKQEIISPLKGGTRKRRTKRRKKHKKSKKRKKSARKSKQN